MTLQRLPETYFRRIYDSSPDPWGFEERWYEQRKYALTLAALPKARYQRAFEPGCSFGVLTSKLADRVDALVSYELLPDVASRARRRLADHAHVEIETRAIPESWPTGSFDLIVLSEVLYYLTAPGVHDVAGHIERSLETGGTLVAVHYREATDYPLTGDEAHMLLARELMSVAKVASWIEPSFRIDVFERAPR